MPARRPASASERAAASAYGGTKSSSFPAAAKSYAARSYAAQAERAHPSCLLQHLGVLAQQPLHIRDVATITPDRIVQVILRHRSARRLRTSGARSHKKGVAAPRRRKASEQLGTAHTFFF